MRSAEKWKVYTAKNRNSIQCGKNCIVYCKVFVYILRTIYMDSLRFSKIVQRSVRRDYFQLIKIKFYLNTYVYKRVFLPGSVWWQEVLNE
jgi:hypothetical protein